MCREGEEGGDRVVWKGRGLVGRLGEEREARIGEGMFFK